jgi:hypothetical protein
MKSKTGKLVNRFITLEIISVVVLLLILPVCFFWLSLHRSKYLTGDIVAYFTMAICIIYPIWGVYKIHGLMKFDFLKDVSNNIYYINRYNIQKKREKKISWFIIPALVILVTLYRITIHTVFPLWILWICGLIIAALISYWSYKKYNKDIISILRSLDEIKELKEEKRTAIINS